MFRAHSVRGLAEPVQAVSLQSRVADQGEGGDWRLRVERGKVAGLLSPRLASHHFREILELDGLDPAAVGRKDITRLLILDRDEFFPRGGFHELRWRGRGVDHGFRAPRRKVGCGQGDLVGVRQLGDGKVDLLGREQPVDQLLGKEQQPERNQQDDDRFTVHLVNDRSDR